MSPIRAVYGLFFAFLLSLSTIAHAREMLSVARPEANMRAGAGTQHDIMWTLSQGYPVEIIGRRGQWYQVRDFENDKGWIYRPLLGKAPHHIVKAQVANLRSGPSLKQRIVGKVQYGDVLRTLEKKGDWVRVRRQDGGTGWVAGRLLWGW